MQKDNLGNENPTDANNVLRAIKNPIVDVCSQTIDLRKVERVGKVAGGTDWLSYTVYFTGGGNIEIYHERKYFEGKPLDQMEREKFIELWRSFNNT